MDRNAMGHAAGMLAALLGLSACATPPASPAQSASAKPAAKADPGCKVEGHNGIYRAGSSVPLFMRVRNTGRWCFSSFGFSGLDAEGSRIVDKPEHGDLRLLASRPGIRFGYRPAPGYVGSDRFLIIMPGVVGQEFNIPVSVHVLPGAPPPAAQPAPAS